MAKVTGRIALQPVVAAQRKAAARGLTLAVEHLLGVSRRLVPHEEGTLERSGTASVDVQRLLGAVSYDTPYAVRQHEDSTLRHDAGRSDHYLSTPMTQERAVMLAVIAAELRRAYG